METGRARILSLKKTQLEVSMARNERVLRGVERQIGHNEKLILRQHGKFQAVQARVMQEKEKVENSPGIRGRIFGLVQSANAVKQGRDRLGEGQLVLHQRKEQGSRVLAVLKKNGELVNGELRKQKLRVEERAEMRDLDYAASLHSLAAVRLRSQSGTEGSSSPVLMMSPVLNQNMPSLPSSQPCGIMDPPASAHCPASEQQQPGPNSSMTISYATKDGSAFEVEVGTLGKELQVFVLPHEEKDRRLLRLRRSDITEALAARGYHIRRFGIAGGGGVPVREK